MKAFEHFLGVVIFNLPFQIQMTFENIDVFVRELLKRISHQRDILWQHREVKQELPHNVDRIV